MPRGFHLDPSATEVAQREGLFLDVDSQIVRDQDLRPHVLLYGKDMMRQREKVFRRAKGRCYLKLDGCMGTGEELDHKTGGLSGRCDCQHNLAPACRSCHEIKTGRTIRFQG